MDIFLHFSYTSLLDRTLRLRFGDSGLFAEAAIKFQIIVSLRDRNRWRERESSSQNEKEIFTRRERSSQRDSSYPLSNFADVFLDSFYSFFKKSCF
ncbi:hypothetical protein AMTRI_Chr01g133010 [Amborella trichopoda]